jgi:hypothetical protein
MRLVPTRVLGQAIVFETAADQWHRRECSRRLSDSGLRIDTDGIFSLFDEYIKELKAESEYVCCYE